MKTRLLSSLKLLSLALLIGLTTSYVFAWTGPTAAPTGGNVSAPVNVGLSNQTKAGSLRLAGIRTSLASYINFASSADLTTKGAPFNALSLAVNGSVGATEYCDQNGENCTTTLGGGGGGTCTAAAGSVYDSGWITLSDSGEETRTFNHNLGTLDTVVYIEGKGDGSDSGYVAANSINYLDVGTGVFYWKDKTENDIKVYRTSGAVDFAKYVKVVIWKKSAIGAGCGGGGSGSIGAPDYDSGWVDFGTTGNVKKRFTHNFGTENYFVNLEGKATGGDDYNCPSYVSNESVNNWLISSGYNFFYDKGTDSISLSVWPNSVTKCARYMRVKLWKHPAGTIAPSSTVTNR